MPNKTLIAALNNFLVLFVGGRKCATVQHPPSTFPSWLKDLIWQLSSHNLLGYAIISYIILLHYVLPYRCSPPVVSGAYQCKGQSVCRGGLRRKLVSIAAHSQPKQTTVHWHGEQGSVHVCIQQCACLCLALIRFVPFAPKITLC